MRKMLSSFVALMAIIVSGVAWSATPVAVWENLTGADTGDGLTYGGLSIKLTANGNTVTDGAIAIGSTGVKVTGLPAGTGAFTVLVKYRDYTAPTGDGVKSVIATAKNSANADRVGIFAGAGTIGGIASGGVFQNTVEGTLATSGVFAFAHQNTEGTSLYQKGVPQPYNNTSLKYSSDNFDDVTIGAFNGEPTTFTPSVMTIEKVAVFLTKLTLDDVNSFAWPSEIDVTEYEVSFTKANATDWESKTLPTHAVAAEVTENTSFAGKAAYLQPLSPRDATVVNVTGASGNAVYGLHAMNGEQAGLGNTTRDIYLMVSGGTFTAVTGGEDATWSGTKTVLTGDTLVNVCGDAVVDFVYGAGMGGGQTVTTTGNVGVVIDGEAQVKGTVAGGWQSRHNSTPKVTGNTSVLVKNVQIHDENAEVSATGNLAVDKGVIVGGSIYCTNGGVGEIGGSSSVVVTIPDETSSATFAKKIVGGSYHKSERNTMVVKGDSSVSISAPDAVTFSKEIVGGGHSTGSESKVVGSSSVTLNGGTYTGTIYAGGDHSAATVGGSATLTINGGVFTGANLKGGTATGTKKLALNCDQEFAWVNISGFDEIAIADTKKLTMSVAGSNVRDLTCALTGAGTFEKTGTGTLVFANAANTYTGTITLAGGMIKSATTLTVQAQDDRYRVVSSEEEDFKVYSLVRDPTTVYLTDRAVTSFVFADGVATDLIDGDAVVIDDSHYTGGPWGGGISLANLSGHQVTIEREMDLGAGAGIPADGKVTVNYNDGVKGAYLYGNIGAGAVVNGTGLLYLGHSNNACTISDGVTISCNVAFQNEPKVATIDGAVTISGNITMGNGLFKLAPGATLTVATELPETAVATEANYHVVPASVEGKTVYSAVKDPTVITIAALGSGSSKENGADYTNAVFTAKVSWTGDFDDANATYTATVGGETYTGTYNADEKTVSFSGIPGTAGAQTEMTFTITSGGETVYTDNGTYIYADQRAWINETAETFGSTGTWTGATPDTTNNKIDISGDDSTFDPNKQMQGQIADVRVAMVFDAPNNETTIPDGVQTALRLATDSAEDDTYKFQVLVNGAWVDVSAEGLVPATGANYEVIYHFDYQQHIFTVKVATSSATYTLASGETTAFALPTSKQKVDGFTFTGAGSVAKLEGEYYDSNMVVDNNGVEYATMEAAIAAYQDGMTFTMLHATGKPAPEGWRLVVGEGGAVTLEKIPNNLISIELDEHIRSISYVTTSAPTVTNRIEFAEDAETRTQVVQLAPDTGIWMTDYTAADGWELDNAASLQTLSNITVVAEGALEGAFLPGDGESYGKFVACAIPYVISYTYQDAEGADLTEVANTNPTAYAVTNETITIDLDLIAKDGYTVTSATPASITAGSTGNQTIAVVLTKIPTYTVTATPVEGATVSFSTTDPVVSGTTVTFTVNVTNDMQRLDTVTTNNTEIKAVDGVYSVTVTDANIVVDVALKQLYTVAAPEVEGAEVTFDSNAPLASGESVKFTVNVTNDMQRLVAVKNGDTVLEPGDDGKYSVTVGTSNVEIEVVLEDLYMVTVTADEGATVEFVTTNVVGSGTNVSFTVTVTDTTKQLASVKVGNETIDAVEGVYTVTPVDDDVVVTVKLSLIPTYTVTATLVDGVTVAFDPAGAVVANTTVSFTVTVTDDTKVVSTVSDGTNTLTPGEDGKYSVTVVDSDIVITVTLADKRVPPQITIAPLGSGSSKENGADYTNATFVAKVTWTGDFDPTEAGYTATVGGTTYTGTYDSADQTVTFTGIPGAAGSKTEMVFTVTSGESTVYTDRGTYVFGDQTRWINETASTFESTGVWTGAQPDAEAGKIALDGDVSTFAPSNSMQGAFADVHVSLIFEEPSDDSEIPEGAQSAIRLATATADEEGNPLTYKFQLLVAGAWVDVSASGLSPTVNTNYDIDFHFDYQAHLFSVQVTTGSRTYVLADENSTVAFAVPSGKTKLESFAFEGSGSVQALQGEYYDSNMVVDNNGVEYATMEEAVAAYQAGMTFTMLHATGKEAPAGWRLVIGEGGTVTLEKIPVNTIAIELDENIGSISYVTTADPTVTNTIEIAEEDLIRTKVVTVAPEVGVLITDFTAADGWTMDETASLQTLSNLVVATEAEVEGALVPTEDESYVKFIAKPIDYTISYTYADAEGTELSDVANTNPTSYTVTNETITVDLELISKEGYTVTSATPAAIEAGSTGDKTIAIVLTKVPTYTVTAAEVDGATVTFSTNDAVVSGTEVTFTVAVTDAMKLLGTVKANDETLTASNNIYSVTVVDTNILVTVTLVDVPTYTVTAPEVSGAEVTFSTNAAVTAGTEVTFTVNVTNDMKRLVAVKNGDTVLEANEETGKYSVTVGSSDIEITVVLEDLYTVTVTCDAGAAVEFTTTNVVGSGTNVSFKVTVNDTTKQLDSVKVGDTALTAADGVYTVTVNGADVEVKVNLSKIPTYTVTATEVDGAKVEFSPAGPYYTGAEVSFTVTVTNDFKVLKSVKVGDAVLESPYSVTVGTSNVVVDVVLANLYTVTAKPVEGATVAFSTTDKLETGAKVTFTVTPDDKKQVVAVKAGETVLTPDENGTYTVTVADANVEITVEVEDLYTVTVTCDEGATATFTTTNVVGSGTNVSFTVSVSDTTKQLDSVKVGDTTLTAVDGTYTVTVNGADVEVKVNLSKIPTYTVTATEVDGAKVEFSPAGPYYTGAEVSFTVTVTNDFKVLKSVKVGDAVLEAPYSITVGTSNVVVDVVLANLYTVTAKPVEGATVAFSTTDKLETGAKVTFTVTPDDKKQVVSVKAGEEVLTPDENGTYTVTVADANVEITVEVEDLYTVTVTCDEGATATFTTTNVVGSGTNVSFTVSVSDTTKQLDSVKVGDTTLTAAEDGTYTVTVNGADVDVKVNLSKIPTYTVTANEVDGAKVEFSPAGPYYTGAEVSFTVTVTNDFKVLKAVKVGDAVLESPYSVTVGTSNVVVDVVLANLYTVTAKDVTGATVAFSTTDKLETGAKVTFTVTPDDKKQVVSVKAGETVLTPDENGTYTVTVADANVEITVEVEDLYTVTVICDEDATATFTTTNVVGSGTNVSFKVTVNDTTKQLESVKVGETALTAAEDGTYTVTPMGADVEVTVTLSLIPTYTVTANEVDGAEVVFDQAGPFYTGATVTFGVNVTNATKVIDTVKNGDVELEAKDGKYSVTVGEANIVITVTLKAKYPIVVPEGKTVAETIASANSENPLVITDPARVSLDGNKLTIDGVEYAIDSLYNATITDGKVTFTLSDAVIPVIGEATVEGDLKPAITVTETTFTVTVVTTKAKLWYALASSATVDGEYVVAGEYVQGGEDIAKQLSAAKNGASRFFKVVATDVAPTK